MASKSDAPKTPDYLGAALAQGQLSKESALSQTGLNRPNEVTPWGSRTWTRTPTQPSLPATGGGSGGSGGVGNPNANPVISTVPNTNQPTDPFGGRIMSSTGGGSGASTAAYSKGLASGSQASAPQTQKMSFLDRLNPVKVVKDFVDTSKNLVTDPFGEDSLKAWQQSTHPGVGNANNSTAAPASTGNPYADLLAASNAAIVNPGDWTSTTTLDPKQQQILDQSNDYKILSGGLAKENLQNFADQGSINFTNPDVRRSDVQTTQLDKFTGAPVAVNADSMQRFQGTPVGLNDLGYTQDSFAAQRASVEDSMFNRAKRNLDPVYSQQEQAMRSRLANQGLTEGSEAYNREFENFNRDRSNAYQNASDSAVLAGGQEQSRLLSDLMASRNQDLNSQLARFNTGMESTGFNNQAAQTDFSNKLQGGLAGFNTGLQANQANNQTAQNEFQQGLAANQANSQYDLQLMQSLLGARGQAFNEAQALGSGNTITMPQFGGFGGAAGSQPADIVGAVNSSYGANLGAVNAQNAQAGQTNQGAAQLAATMAMLYFSDRRLKSNIQRVGTGFSGLPVYSYDMFGESETGYMAQEVEAVFPEAVVTHPSGFLMVNYSMLGGRP